MDKNRKIALLGDSITESFRTSNLLPEFNIVNLGVHGENSGDLLKRLDSDIKRVNPDYVFLLIGTNDFAVGLNDDQIKNNFVLIIRQIKKMVWGDNIFLTSILPTKNIDNRPNYRIKKINNILLELTKQETINYFDLFPAFLDSNGELKSSYTTDGLHLSSTGYKSWAVKLTKLLNSIN